MTNEQWMQLYLQAWAELSEPVAWRWWDLMWRDCWYTLTWNPPTEGYVEMRGCGK